MRHIIAALVCLLASATLVAAACDGLGKTACTAESGCVWCVSAAFPAACYADFNNGDGVGCTRVRTEFSPTAG
jgi:hypothetical protein